MVDRPFDMITSDDIARLIQEHQQESRAMEFKRDLPGGSDSERKEFLADVSSFANAIGGDLLYGIKEERGRAVEVVGVSAANIEAEILRLENMIRDGIRPRVIGCRLRAITGFPTGPVIVIRVPRSLLGPHIISYQQDFRFYSRTSAGKFRMDVSDIRDAVLNTATIPERARAVRAERLARIVAGESPVPIDGNRIVCVHVVPHAAFTSSAAVNLKGATSEAVRLSPFFAFRHAGHSAPRFNLDGICTETRGNSSANPPGYLQLFRTGVLETVDISLLSDSDKPKDLPSGLPSAAFADALFRFIDNAVKLYAALDIAFPVTILLSLTGMKGLVLYVSRNVQLYMPRLSFDRDLIQLPELVLEDPPSNVQRAVRPILDSLWQAAGSERCLDCDDTDESSPHH